MSTVIVKQNDYGLAIYLKETLTSDPMPLLFHRDGDETLLLLRTVLEQFSVPVDYQGAIPYDEYEKTFC